MKSRFIMNGVCVCWRGWIDLERLDGVGCLEFDEERATVSTVARCQRCEFLPIELIVHSVLCRWKIPCYGIKLIDTINGFANTKIDNEVIEERYRLIRNVMLTLVVRLQAAALSPAEVSDNRWMLVNRSLE